jgi:PAS domain-containing protein
VRRPAVARGVCRAPAALIAWLTTACTLAEAAQRTTAAESSARLERLDAILNTTADGIIVIDAGDASRRSTPAPKRLFGYPESESWAAT